MLESLLHLFYPKLCLACGKALIQGENNICTFCNAHLPRTNWHLDNENAIKKLFGGRIPLENATAYLYFNKGETVQQLLHQLKYKNKQQVGLFLGHLAGTDLKQCQNYTAIDAIVPVPLHKAKQRARGYNQSEKFAQGLGGVLQIPVLPHLMERKILNETQTNKTRYHRWKNVEGVFMLNPDGKQYANKHLLLVDDVVTTGATLEACACELLKIPDVKLSIAVIASA